MMVNPIEERPISNPSRFTTIWAWIFPALSLLLFLFPLLFINTKVSHYAEKPVLDRRLNLKGLELITTNYLNEHPEAFDKLIRIVTSADEALQVQEFPPHGVVMKWLKHAMYQEGFDDEMPIYYFLRTVYLNEWEGAYFHQVDQGEREYLYDLLGAMIGGLYRCVCAPPEHR